MPRRDPGDIVETHAPDQFSGVVLRGSFHIGLSQAVGVGCMIGSVLILSRLLSAEDFGLVAMIAPVMALLMMFRDLGLLQAVVQKEDLTYGQLNTLFWVNMSLSLALMALLWSAAPWIAAFYNAPDLVWLIRAMAGGILLTGLGAQHFALMNRQMMFGRMAINASVVGVLSLVVAVFWAWVAPSPWALVAGTLSSAVLGAILVWLWVPWRPGLPGWAPGSAALFGFGAGVTGFNLANFFSRNLDSVLIGRVWGSAALGFYDRAYKLLLFPLNHVAQPLSQVMVPVLSRLQNQPERYKHAFFRVFGIMQLAILPGVAAATAMADTAVPFLLGAKWAEAAPIFAALGLAALMQPLGNPSGWLFISQGRTTEMAWWGVVSAILTCGAFVLSVEHGVVALATTYAAVSAVRLIPLWLLVCRKGPVRIDSLIARVLPVLMAVVAAYAMLLMLRDALPDADFAKLVVGTLCSYGVFAAVFAISPFGRQTLREALALGSQGIARLRVNQADGLT